MRYCPAADVDALLQAPMRYERLLYLLLSRLEMPQQRCRSPVAGQQTSFKSCHLLLHLDCVQS